MSPRLPPELWFTWRQRAGIEPGAVHMTVHSKKAERARGEMPTDSAVRAPGAWGRGCVTDWSPNTPHMFSQPYIWGGGGSTRESHCKHQILSRGPWDVWLVTRVKLGLLLSSVHSANAIACLEASETLTWKQSTLQKVSIQPAFCYYVFWHVRENSLS